MDKNIEAVQDSTVAGLGRLAGFFGFSEVMGRLYGFLLLSPDALSLDDLAEGLQISKGSVSMNMRSLERWGMAKEVWVRGERKKYYMAESDFWTVIRNVLSGREMREVQIALCPGASRRFAVLLPVCPDGPANPRFRERGD